MDKKPVSASPQICMLRDLNNSKEGLKSPVEVIPQRAANALSVTNGTRPGVERMQGKNRVLWHPNGFLAPKLNCHLPAAIEAHISHSTCPLFIHLILQSGKLFLYLPAATSKAGQTKPLWFTVSNIQWLWHWACDSWGSWGHTQLNTHVPPCALSRGEVFLLRNPDFSLKTCRFGC